MFSSDARVDNGGRSEHAKNGLAALGGVRRSQEHRNVLCQSEGEKLTLDVVRVAAISSRLRATLQIRLVPRPDITLEITDTTTLGVHHRPRITLALNFCKARSR